MRKPVEEEKKDNREVISKPKICCIDLTNDALTRLSGLNYHLFAGTLGTVRDLPIINKDKELNGEFDYSFPANFHEFDILILDLTNNVRKPFVPLSMEKIKTAKTRLFIPICRYPTTIFDPKPAGAFELKRLLGTMKNRPFISIVFASDLYVIEYSVKEITIDSAINHLPEKHDLYCFDPTIPLSEAKYGIEVTVCDVREDLNCLLNKHRENLKYHQTFYNPTDWDNESEEIPASLFYPLMTNIVGEIVSFYIEKDNKLMLVLPDFCNKADFLEELMQNVLPAMVPSLFPFSTKFKWLEDKEYFVPNHNDLLTSKDNLFSRYQSDVKALDKKITENVTRYQFLRDLITETSDRLVKAVSEFFQWLDFKNVHIKDEHNQGMLEEDIEVELDEGILVVEVKGLGGTSTDAHCSQIAKIRNRRQKEREAFDVSALYIVNHQRFLPPLSRKNPPFSQVQIQDAENDDRGLLSTWQLFTLFYDIENSIITKEVFISVEFLPVVSVEKLPVYKRLEKI